MKILDKLKNALFEEEDVDTEEDELVKQVDVKKTIENEKKEKEEKKTRRSRFEDKKLDEIEEPEDSFVSSFDFSKETTTPKTPIIFNDEDFISDTRELDFTKVPKKEEKILYRGHDIREEKNKDKFKPSPIISPVYGILNKDYTMADPTGGIKTENDLRELSHSYIDIKEVKKEQEIDIDTVRQKAFGDYAKEEDDDLMYDMTSEEEKPEINKITIGDAEEYFNDLGLEYNVDYTDKEPKKNTTRVEKNEKENYEEKEPETEEKNLYDLIDLMYDEKE